MVEPTAQAGRRAMAFRCWYSGVHSYSAGSSLSGSEVEGRHYANAIQDACGGERWMYGT
jgi:hypothetical protein